MFCNEFSYLLLDMVYLMVIYSLVWQKYNYQAIAANGAGMNGCHESRILGRDDQNRVSVQSARVLIGIHPERARLRKCNNVSVIGKGLLCTESRYIARGNARAHCI